ncbi:hypothetical protein GCM10010990_13280 [Croceicoccus mobilis]|uniref:Uncharacterized protein n=2 Tax=Croceicoccus mobilis TaxID=1703339 RepID=A0A916YXY5_9SPHN|nr:hypothetical protein GCM10010990_13280 [Croceicoccus mobilis]
MPHDGSSFPVSGRAIGHVPKPKGETMIRKHIRRIALTACAAALVAGGQPAIAQSLDDSPIITLYKFAPGKMEEAVRMMAIRDKVFAEAEIPVETYYFHQQGAGWMLVVISPPWKEEYGDKAKAAREKLGVPKDAFEAWPTVIADHEDIIVEGPTTAAAKIAEWDKAKAEE